MSIACQCASIRPGMSVRPPPSMSVVVALRPIGIGLVETRSILFPRTSTVLGPDRAVLFPSKIRTFRNSVTASPDGVEGPAPGASCAWPAWQRLSRNAANTRGRYCPCFSVRIMCAHLQYANLGLRRDDPLRESPPVHRDALKQHLVGLGEVDDGIWSLYFCNVLSARLDDRDYVLGA